MTSTAWRIYAKGQPGFAVKGDEITVALPPISWTALSIG